MAGKLISDLNSGILSLADAMEIDKDVSGTRTSFKTTVKDIVDFANHNVADEYDSTSTYAIGDYVMYESTLYKCITAVSSAENFDSTKWTAVVVTDEMGSGGGDTGGHTIIDENGNSMTARSGLQFTGAVEVTDDSANNRTLVEVLGGDFYNPVIYSTEEREIGVWTDGKPLYQKTIVLASSMSITSNTWTDIDNGDWSFIDTFVLGLMINDNGASVGFVAVDKNTQNNKLRIMQTRSTSITCKSVTIQYTKTTDTAGSGSWTPQGVPAVHYSTDEQVIGTYLGETLYKKTWVLENEITLPSNTWTAIPPIPKTLFSKITNCEVINNAGSYVGFIQTAFDSAASDYLRLMNVRNANVDVKEITLNYTKSS